MRKILVIIGVAFWAISCLVLSIALFVAGSVILGLLPTAFVLYVFIAIFVGKIKEKKRKICPECQERFDFDTDVEYEQQDTIHKSYPISSNPIPKAITEKLTYKFEVTCTCHKCGHQTRLHESYQAGVAYYDGTTKFYNVEDYIKRDYSGPLDSEKKGSFALFLLLLVLGTISLALGIFVFSIGPLDVWFASLLS